MWAERFDKVLLDGHYEALRLGYERAGDFEYDPAELKVLARGIKDTESQYLQGYRDADGVWHNGFVQDLKSGDDPRYFDEEGLLKPGSLDARSDLYVGRMRGTANEAFLDASPEDATYDWELGVSEHCADCIELADLSPYTRDTIISFPGDGGTSCLGNCGCRLVRDDGVEGFGHHALGLPDEEADSELDLAA